MIVPLFMDEVDIFLRTITGAVGDRGVAGMGSMGSAEPINFQR